MNENTFPSIFVENMKNMLGENVDEFFETYSQNPYRGISLNTKKISIEDFKKRYYDLENVKWSDTGLYIDDDLLMSKDTLYHTGLYYIQEPSAMAPVNFLSVEKGQKVLDLCASPGGKTFQISNKLSDEDILISNDINNKRISPLIRNIEYYGMKNVMITNESQENLLAFFPEYFDRILIDAPCSGEGMFRKDKKLISSHERTYNTLISVQRDLLEKAASMLKTGGRMLYSTCTFNMDENENNILNFIKNHGEFRILDIKKDFGMTSFSNLKEVARFFPHLSKSEGHFLCLMEKTDSFGVENKIEYSTKKYIKRKKLPVEYLKFEDEFLNIKMEGNFLIDKDNIYLEIFDKILPKKFRAARNGLYLGEIKNSKFMPSSAFIRYLKADDIKNIIRFDKKDANLLKYIKGETILVDEKDDDYVICIDDFPVGYAKVKNSKLKNMYNKNWRMI